MCVIINYKKLPKASVTKLQKTRSRLADLEELWKEIRHLHGRITLAITTEDRKKLFYFIQDEFLAAKDTYNEAADFRKQ
jgi:benzoyl-CoA reductase/2-hydroxyglutaryl-CoA dehydratase subunit BcrC/BadD/HgdB